MGLPANLWARLLAGRSWEAACKRAEADARQFREDPTGWLRRLDRLECRRAARQKKAGDLPP
jgi:hypothetical protein